MATPALAAAAGPDALLPTVVRWPLPGCRFDRLHDLFSVRALAELARAAGATDGAVVLELGGHTLQAPAGSRLGWLYLFEACQPPAGLRSLVVRNGAFALRHGIGLAFESERPVAVCLERVKLTRPAPGGTGRRVPVTCDMVNFAGAVSGVMRGCRVELSPSGPAGFSSLQMAVGVVAHDGAHVVLEDVDVVGKQGAGRSLSTACIATTGARLELNRCAGTRATRVP
jgi:hypothetical protein